MFQVIPRGLGNGWEIYSPPSSTKSDLQLNCRTINPNDQLKSSCRGVLYPKIYRSSYVENDKEDGDSGDWPCKHMQWRSQRDISAVKLPREECRVSSPKQDPQPRTPGPGRRTCIASGSEKQWGFCPKEGVC